MDESDAQALVDSLRRMGLLDVDEIPQLEPLTGGVSSLIVRADTRRGPLCIKRALAKLKVAAHWEAPVERNPRRGRLDARGGADRSGGGACDPGRGQRGLCLRNGVASHLRAIRSGKRSCVMASLSRRPRRLLAATWRQFTPPPQETRTWLANSPTTPASTRSGSSPIFAATARARPECAEALERLVATTAHTKLTLVHGDVSPKNILAGPHGPVFLDAECAWYGDPAFDLAFCLNHLLLKCVWRPANTDAYLACFDTLSTTYFAGVNWEPRESIEARTAALLAGMLLARIDGKSPAEYITAGTDRERVRRFAIPR